MSFTVESYFGKLWWTGESDAEEHSEDPPERLGRRPQALPQSAPNDSMRLAFRGVSSCGMCGQYLGRAILWGAVPWGGSAGGGQY